VYIEKMSDLIQIVQPADTHRLSSNKSEELPLLRPLCDLEVNVLAMIPHHTMDPLCSCEAGETLHAFYG
jgi:hypothetical protein